MNQITLKYTPAGGALTTRTLRVLWVKGIKSPEKVELYPQVQHEHLDGFLLDDIQGFRRGVAIDFGVVDDPDDQKAILDFVLDKNRKVIYKGMEVSVSLADLAGYEADWFEGFSGAPQFYLELRESSVRTSFPTE